MTTSARRVQAAASWIDVAASTLEAVGADVEVTPRAGSGVGRRLRERLHLPPHLDPATFTELDGADHPGHPDQQRTVAVAVFRLGEYIGLESAAEEVHNFETIVIPGLLQTEAYARAVMTGEATQPTSDAIQQRVAARLERQKLIRGGSLRLVAVIDEAVLHRQIGGREGMQEQLSALLDASKRFNMTLQVIPFREGAYASMLSSFHVLHFPGTPGVVYIEGLTGDLYAEGDDVGRCEAVFSSLRSSALSPTASAAMIRKVRDAQQT